MKAKYKVRIVNIKGEVKDKFEYTADAPGRNWELVGVSMGKETYGANRGFQLFEMWRLPK